MTYLRFLIVTKLLQTSELAGVADHGSSFEAKPCDGRWLLGKLFGDRGYISQPLPQQFLVEHGVRLITKLRKNLHNHLLDLGDKLLLRKRAVTLDDQRSTQECLRDPRIRAIAAPTFS